MITIDGSVGSGGGQVIRTAVSLSALTGKPCTIKRIRENRPNPGLQTQHMIAVSAVADLCNATVKGNEKHSTKLTFMPGKLTQKNLDIEIPTAASVSLVLQAILPLFVGTKKERTVEIHGGGTAVLWSPSIFYFKNAFCSFLRAMGMDIDVTISKHSFYPKGGGHVTVSIKPNTLRELNLIKRESFERTDIFSLASEILSKHAVVQRQITGAEKILPVTYRVEHSEPTQSTGSLVHMHTHYRNTVLGSDMLGEKGVQSETIGERCASQLQNQIRSGACLDRWAADQILVYLALCKKPSTVSIAEVSQHTKTNISTIEHFLSRTFTIENKGTHALLTVV